MILLPTQLLIALNIASFFVELPKQIWDCLTSEAAVNCYKFFGKVLYWTAIGLLVIVLLAIDWLTPKAPAATSQALLLGSKPMLCLPPASDEAPAATPQPCLPSAPQKAKPKTTRKKSTTAKAKTAKTTATNTTAPKKTRTKKSE